MKISITDTNKFHLIYVSLISSLYSVNEIIIPKDIDVCLLPNTIIWNS